MIKEPAPELQCPTLEQKPMNLTAESSKIISLVLCRHI